MKISRADKSLIKAYCRWWKAKGFIGFPHEYDLSNLIDNMNCDHRDLVEHYLSELRLAYDQEGKI